MLSEIILIVKLFLIFLLKETQTQTSFHTLNKWLGNTTGILRNTVLYHLPVHLRRLLKIFRTYQNTPIYHVLKHPNRVLHYTQPVCSSMSIQEEQLSHFHSFLSLGAVLQSTGLHCQDTPATHFHSHTLECLSPEICATLQAPALLFQLPLTIQSPPSPRTVSYQLLKPFGLTFFSTVHSSCTHTCVHTPVYTHTRVHTHTCVHPHSHTLFFCLISLLKPHARPISSAASVPTYKLGSRGL